MGFTAIIENTATNINVINKMFFLFISFFLFSFLFIKMNAYSLYSYPKCLYAGGNTILPLKVLEINPI